MMGGTAMPQASGTSSRIRAATALPRKPNDNPGKNKWLPIDDVSLWTTAQQIVDQGWVTDERLGDVVAWLNAHWREGLELDEATRATLNESLDPAIPDDGPDARDWASPLIDHVEHATGLTLPTRLREVIGVAVLDASLLLELDNGRGRRIADAHRFAYARDEDCKFTGGLRAVLAGRPGVREHEACKVSLLVLGTAARDRVAFPVRDARFGESSLGASGALVSSCLGLPVTVPTALGWAHAATRALYPDMTRAAMCRFVSRPIMARYAALAGAPLPPVPARGHGADPAHDCGIAIA